MDHAASLSTAVEIAKDCLEGRITPLQAARSIFNTGILNGPAWSALNGAAGPLAAFYAAGDEADRLHFLGEDVELWHPGVRDRKRTELAEAEAKMAPEVQAACRALIDYAARSVE